MIAFDTVPAQGFDCVGKGPFGDRTRQNLSEKAAEV